MARLYKAASHDARVSWRIRGRSASLDLTVHIGILGGRSPSLHVRLVR